jgi:hypothetical protein
MSDAEPDKKNRGVLLPRGGQRQEHTALLATRGSQDETGAAEEPIDAGRRGDPLRVHAPALTARPRLQVSRAIAAPRDQSRPVASLFYTMAVNEVCPERCALRHAEESRSKSDASRGEVCVARKNACKGLMESDPLRLTGAPSLCVRAPDAPNSPAPSTQRLRFLEKDRRGGLAQPLQRSRAECVSGIGPSVRAPLSRAGSRLGHAPTVSNGRAYGRHP